MMVGLLRLLFQSGAARAFVPYGPDDDGRFDERPDALPDPRARGRTTAAARSPFGQQDPGERHGARGEQRSAQNALPSRKLLALTGLALAALLVALGALGVEAQLASRPHTTVAATASGTATATATPAPAQTGTPSFINPTPVNLSALGWVKRTLSWVERVAAAPSAPGAVYACGGVAGANSWTINFAVSQDGGHSWTTASTGLQAVSILIISFGAQAPGFSQGDSAASP